MPRLPLPPPLFWEEFPLERAGRPEEVASLVSWLVSDEAEYATGVSFLLDGGMAQQTVER